MRRGAGGAAYKRKRTDRNMENGENMIPEVFMHLMKVRMGLRRVLMRELRAQGLDINFETLQVLNRVWRCPGITQQALADRTVRDKSSITCLVNKLERDGLVTREEDEADRRNKRLYLSEEGRRMACVFAPAIGKVYDEIEERMGRDGEAERCVTYLNRMYDVLEKM